MKLEKKTVEVMITMYCSNHHQSRNGACPDCQELVDYAWARLDKCPLKDSKPTCGKCTIHCYQPSMKTKIRSVMKYAGPRIVYKHPILASMYIIKHTRKQKTVHKNINCKTGIRIHEHNDTKNK